MQTGGVSVARSGTSLRRVIAVLTTGRQDWGILRSTCIALRHTSEWDLRVIVGGMHLSDAFGRTEFEVVSDGFHPAERLDWVSRDDGAIPPIEQAGRALTLVGEALGRQAPEFLLLMGDRFETASAAIAACLLGVPVAHLHGGEETEGAVDNAFRHAITQMSRLHLVSHDVHAQRVISMGADATTVHVVGAPGLDNLNRPDLPTRAELAQRLGMELDPPLVAVTLHPATASSIDVRAEAEAVCAAMDEVDATYVITLPNTDPGHEQVCAALLQASRKRRRIAVSALGSRFYWGLLKSADAMLGNSSSGIIESSALALPAVNVGDRQQGRLRGGNVLDAPSEPGAIVATLRRAIDPATRTAIRGLSAPFGKGRSGEAILSVLNDWRPTRSQPRGGSTSGARA